MMSNLNYKTYDAVVIGTGAAGYNAACRIKEGGQKSVCIVTEGRLLGTSRNTGSDKQTYYKLGLGGSAPDSVVNMAGNLFAGGCVDGDNALCEAALSARCFFHLCEIGVPFPHNRYGEYVGYKTDHDPYARATSAGPLTSKFMTEALEKKAKSLGVTVYDRLLAIEILKHAEGVCGLLCLDLQNGGFVAFRAPHVILATGGPAGIYAQSVYPACHMGSSSLALRAGASLQNMTEWQYGLASVAPRWNVSGTYMQVLPRLVSVDEKGVEYEILAEHYANPYEALSMLFLKGYQWPFDVKKALEGSSVIDLLVYRETVMRGRRVYLDFTKNPFGLEEIDFAALSEEAHTYLKNAGACFGTPIQRLWKMNSPAVDLYRGYGVDITKDYLEIALCAQHNNGGVAVDRWWQSDIEGLFAAGECAGTHGITRPGGSALNAGQVGSLRAAQFVGASPRVAMKEDAFEAILASAVEANTALCGAALQTPPNVSVAIPEARERMSACGAAIRDVEAMEDALAAILDDLTHFSERFGIASESEAEQLYRLRDILTVQAATLTATIDYAKTVGLSRGSALYRDPKGQVAEGLEEIFRFTADLDRQTEEEIQHVFLCEEGFGTRWRVRRPLPQNEDFFENVWRSFRQNQNID